MVGLAGITNGEVLYMKNVMVFVAFCALTGCAPMATEQLIKQTASGNPEVEYMGDIKSVNGILTEECVSTGGNVEDSGSNYFVCKERQMPDNILYKAMFKPRYSTDDTIKTRYSYYERDGFVIISAVRTSEYANAFGQVTKFELSTVPVKNELQRNLDRLFNMYTQYN